MLTVALLAAVGGHWAILQSCAWATMLADNLQTKSFSTAIRRTFDGQHPCRCCEAIAAAKKSERKSDFPALKVKKFDFANETHGFVFVAPTTFRLLPDWNATAEPEPFAPPIPPPRIGAA